MYSLGINADCSENTRGRRSVFKHPLHKSLVDSPSETVWISVNAGLGGESVVLELRSRVLAMPSEFVEGDDQTRPFHQRFVESEARLDILRCVD